MPRASPTWVSHSPTPVIRFHQTWQGLAAFYIAPEADQLLTATGPVKYITASLGEDLETVAAALRVYATETAAIQTASSSFVEWPRPWSPPTARCRTSPPRSLSTSAMPNCPPRYSTRFAEEL